MPQGELFWNPYRMVPIRGEVPRRRPLTEERFTGYSGLFVCTLKNLTSLFVGRDADSSLQSLKFMKRNGRCVIPGSSLKGVFRSLAELIGGGCFVSNTTGKGDRYPNLNNAFKACGNYRSLCVTCRMFGMMGRGQGTKMHKGKISIGDALICDEEIRLLPFDILLMNHGTRHTAFYETPTTNQFDLLSRKMYFHQPRMKEQVPSILENIRQLMRDGIQTIEALAPNHRFRFEVRFSNLEHDELKLLIYSLVLEEEVRVSIAENGITLRGPLRHKIGMAKPLGLGSCEISIDSLLYFPEAKTRFGSLEFPETTVYGADSLTREIEKLTAGFVKDTSPTMEHLRKMMVWDESDPRHFHYPDYHWFKTPNNAAVKLKPV